MIKKGADAYSSLTTFYQLFLTGLVLLLFITLLIFKDVLMPLPLLLTEAMMFILFVFGSFLTKSNTWGKYPGVRIFFVAVFIRILAVFFFYHLFESYNGKPFMLLKSDEMGYNGLGLVLSNHFKNWEFSLFKYYPGDFADFGYPYFLGAVYSVFGYHLIVARIVQAVFSGLSVVVLYKIVKYYYPIQIARLTVSFMIFSPILIQFAGIHLKESVFIFLILMSMYQTMLYFQNTLNLYRLLLVLLFTFPLFAFRTVVGVAMVLSFLLYFILRQTRRTDWVLRTAGFGIIIALFFIIMAQLPIISDVEKTFTQPSQMVQIVVKSSSSSLLPKIAGMPLFIMAGLMGPFPNVVTYSSMSGQMLALFLMFADCVLKGLLAFFAVNGLMVALRKDITNSAYLLIVFLTNFLIIAYSGYAFNFRFQLPILPLFYLFSALGIYYMTRKKYIFFSIYVFVYIGTVLAFNFLKVSDFGIFLH
jgi:4-amino-4-deoxy-L-arabinose transferase-like glycosyltransferase